MKFTPLPNSRLLVSLVGLIIVSIKLANETFDLTWGFTFILIFLIIITASFISITPGKNEFVD